MYLFVIITLLKITLNVFQCVLGQLVLTVTRFCFLLFAQIMLLPVWCRHTEHMDIRLLKLTPYCPKSLLLTVSQRSTC